VRDLSFSSYHSANSLNLFGGLITQLNDLVKCVCDLTGFAGPFAGQSYLEITFLEGNERF
jgi:hypothetical protein